MRLLLLNCISATKARDTPRPFKSFQCTCANSSKLIWAHRNNRLLGLKRMRNSNFDINCLSGTEQKRMNMLWFCSCITPQCLKSLKIKILVQLLKSNYTNLIVICWQYICMRCMSPPTQGELSLLEETSVNTIIEKSWKHKSSRIHQPCLVHH